MSDDKKQIKTFKKVYPQIYSYILPDRHQNDGWQKIGYTERKDAKVRIREQNETASHKEPYDIKWIRPARKNNNEWFKDHELHRYYQQNAIPKDEGRGTEWFYFNGTPDRSIELFEAFCQNRFIDDNGKISYTLRSEQEDAVEQTLEYVKNNQTTDFKNPNEKAEFLWNAKPRFGKTLTTYDFMKRFGATKTLIVTNRPAIADSWYNDYKAFIDGYYFISTADSIKEKTLTREEFNQIEDFDKKQITFLSLQDLKGAKVFGGSFDKLQWVADLEWDLLVIDEAHEAVDTDKTDRAFENIKRKFTLHLSGTPFKALAEGKFSSEQIYNWTYLDEQKAKQSELKNGQESGDHTDMPDLRLFNYKISDITAKQIEEGIDVNGENVPPVFEFNDFLATNSKGEFKREDDIWRFLNTLTENEGYPFSTPELRNELKHTFWFVGNRVNSAKAMEKLLKKHPVFENYKIILAAGDGRSLDNEDSEEEAEDFRKNEKALARVKKAIKEHDKTITLSVGQLTTGVTVKEWSAVLMMSDVKKETLYTQAIFRAQNPYKYEKDGKLYRKKSAYVFDFSPYRVLEIYDKLANSLSEKSAIGNITESERQENVAELLNFFPVLSQDENGKMVELDASQVLTLPAAKMASDIVKRRFITNLLFKDIGNVFNLPSEIVKKLNKVQNSKEDGTANKKEKHDVSANRERDEQKQKRISANRNIIWGQKVYGEPIREAFERAQEDMDSFETQLTNTINEDILSAPIAKYVEVYAPSKKEVKELEEKIVEKIKTVSEEFKNSPQTEKEKTKAITELADFVEKELPRDMIDNREEQAYQDDAKNELDIIREKLRTFSRAIPSFVMAAKDPKNLTIDNLQDAVSDEDFEMLFNERDKLHTPDRFTKADFIELRDGGDYEENGEIIHFDGFFEKYRFNAAIQEFEKKREQLADYLNNTTKEDIFSYIPAQKSNQIFTPREVVNKMLNTLEAENPGIFSNPNLTFCDLYVKSGLFLTETAKRLNLGLANIIPDEQARLKHIFEKQLFGFAPTQIIYDIAANYIYGGFPKISRQNLKKKDLTEQFKKGEPLNMKFDVVIGNPPYQEETKDTSDKPIYNYFMSEAYKFADKVCFITPARFLFNAGKTPKKWNAKMLNDKHLKVAYYEQDSSNVFPNTDIKGGVAITYRDTQKDFGKIGTFTHFEELNSILRKVVNNSFESIEPIVGVQLDYKFKKEFNISQVGLKTNVFNKQKHLFTDSRVTDTQIAILGLNGRNRIYKYIEEEYFILPQNHQKWKVYLPTSNGSGAIGEVLSTPLIGEPLIGEPLIGHTETFIGIGEFDNQEEAENLLKYIKTKFARTMLGTLKITQHNLASTWKNVPLQNFTNNSDIDWSQSIAQIDQQLYKKYGLSEKEIAFIEEKVRAME
jgi:type II restriction endonuclease, putative